MNQNEVNGNQQNSNMPRVVPPVVKPPVVTPPIARPVVAPPIVKPPVSDTTASVEKLEQKQDSIVNVQDSTISKLDIEPVQPIIKETSDIKEKEEQDTFFESSKELTNEPNEPKINDLVRGQVKVNTLNEQTSEDIKDELDDETIIRNYMKKLKRRKIIKVFLSIILVLTLLFLIIKFFPIKKPEDVEKKEEHISVIYDKDNYIAVKGENGYGYINTKGKVMIPFQYKNAYDFYGDYALVETDDETKKYNIIDLKGNVVQTTPFMPFYHMDYGVWEIENKLYNDKLELISKKDQIVLYVSGEYFYYQNHEKKEYGILDSKGKNVLKFSNEQSNLQISNNEYLAKEVYVISKGEDNNLNIISLLNSKIVYTKPSDEVEINHINNNVFKVLNKSDNTYTWIYIKNGEVIYETNDVLNNLSVYDYTNEILVADSKYGKYFYNVKTKETTNEPTTKSNVSIYGYNVVTENNLMGLEKNGKTILETKYTNVKFLDETLFNYIKNDRDKEFVLAIDYGKIYLIDANKNKIIATFNSINYILFKNTTFLRLDILNANGDLDHYLIYNLMTGQKLEAQLDENIYYGVNYISISDGKKVRYYNNEFKKIYEERL